MMQRVGISLALGALAAGAVYFGKDPSAFIAALLVCAYMGAK